MALTRRQHGNRVELKVSGLASRLARELHVPLPPIRWTELQGKAGSSSDCVGRCHNEYGIELDQSLWDAADEEVERVIRHELRPWWQASIGLDHRSPDCEKDAEIFAAETTLRPGPAWEQYP